MSANINVAIKVRPLIKREKDQKLTSQWHIKNNSITCIGNPIGTEPYCFGKKIKVYPIKILP